MSLRRLNILNWPIRTKVLSIFLIANLLPILIVLVPAVSQRVNSLRQQNEVRLETLGPYEVTRMNEALETLVAGLNSLISAPTDYAQIEKYLSEAPTATEAQRAELQRWTDVQALKLMNAAPSVTRIRFVDSQAHILMDTVRENDIVTTTYGASSDVLTPADLIIQMNSFGSQSTTGELYLGPDGDPLVDVILTFRPSWDISGSGAVIGHVVFTHDLMRTREDKLLPDLYAGLQGYPEGSLPAHVFLLNRQGELISPAQNHKLLESAASSQGFQAAQRFQTGVSSYFSPLLKSDVLGYHQTVKFRDGPQMTFLIETPLANINEQAFREVTSALLPVALVGLLIGLFATLLANNLFVRPIVRLTDAARRAATGRQDIVWPAVRYRDEIGVLTNVFQTMSTQLLSAIGDLELRVTERTRNLETTLEIGRVLTSIRDLDTLLEEVVNLIRSQFETIYHVQVFLIDERTHQARLRASTGAVGRLLLQRGHSIDVGSQSVIGSVAASGHAVVALDTSNNPIHQRNEFLPDTRAEMALPLRIGDRVVGALDLQSTQPDAFSEQDVELFQGMADQITIAIENAVLFEESNVRLQQIETLNRILSRTAWQEVTQGRERQGLSAAAGHSATDESGWTALQQEAMRTRQIAERVHRGTVTLAVPVLLRDEVLGAVEWEIPEGHYTQNVRQTALELTARLALTADNIRLFERSRRIAQREGLVNQISSKLVGTTSIDEILQTAVRELGLALRSPQTAVQLFEPTGPNGQSDE